MPSNVRPRRSVVVRIISLISVKNELKMTTNWLSKNRYLLSILWCPQAVIARPGLYLLQVSPLQKKYIGEWTLNLHSIDE